MSRASVKPRLLRAAARLLLLLTFGAGQAVFAAHVHEIPSASRSAAVRRADASAADADCPVCQLAAQARSAAAPACAAPLVFHPTVLVSSVRADAPARGRVLRAAARAPPSAA
jgi:hypothetical protein